MDLGATKEIFEKGHDKGEIYVLTSLDEIGLRKGTVRWRMGKERVRKMKIEKWVFMTYRIDCPEIGKYHHLPSQFSPDTSTTTGSSVTANKWVEVAN
ncbi:hypothetical protein IW261DRAFT_87752 [Armillaria novae-zelandiae]|uniref:Uncharacterized protein n=1 Tax=Armillaria novae-zelandiae TaxID=153914 RepID=A0AA39PXE2_9AGAR|nr:hypothetical protein IW261DRAFT_87752 [Armillaria novae-zelandiae]